MFDMRRQNRRNQADVMTQHEPKSDPRTFPTSSYADHKLDVARRRLTTFFIFFTSPSNSGARGLLRKPHAIVRMAVKIRTSPITSATLSLVAAPHLSKNSSHH